MPFASTRSALAESRGNRRTRNSRRWLAVVAWWYALMPTTWLAAQTRTETVFPGKTWPQKSAAEVGLDEELLLQARDYALGGGGSGYVTRHGYLVLSWGDVRQRFDLKSTTKSFGAVALGLAIGDGKLNLDDRVLDVHPQFGVPPESNRQTGWLPEITLRHLATHTAGFAKPGGYEPLMFRPGSRWSYSDGGPNWLAECITLAYRRDVSEWMFERVFTRLGITAQDLTWRRNSYRPAELDGIPRREFGSGISANVDAMARIGYLQLRGGLWADQQILPAAYVAEAGRPAESLRKLPVEAPDSYGRAAQHYGLLWWNNGDGTLADVPRDAYWSWGLYDSLIVVIPSLDLVVSRAGQSWKRGDKEDHYQVLQPFLGPLCRAAEGRSAASNSAATGGALSNCATLNCATLNCATLNCAALNCAALNCAALNCAALNCAATGGAASQAGAATGGPPYPPSPVFQGIRWGPADEILRLAPGSDNWPLTWADDDRLYTAYGDGRGFAPFVRRKLSLGLAMIEGSPPHMTASNLESSTADALGDGAAGRKASGLLMVDGVLYMLVRNCNNAQLGWSADHGRSWTWAEWKFEQSFGCPTFLNFSANYAQARDNFVYVYSHDSDSAYLRADRMVLARADKSRLRDRKAYEFFVRLDAEGQPVWDRNLAVRGAVFENPGRCYRSSISFHPQHQRYLWCQTGDGDDTRFAGGLAIYDGPEPWGPWTSVYYSDRWDVGPGETSSIPPRWLEPDGRGFHLVFSGDDAFSVRRGEFLVE